MSTTERQQPDAIALETAEGWVSELSEVVCRVELKLATLGGFFEEHSLGKALVGAMGLSAEELREQLPALRQAVRDLQEGEQ